VLETVETSFIFMKLISSHGTFSISFFIYTIYHVSIFNATRECASSSTQVVKDLTDSLLLFVSPGKSPRCPVLINSQHQSRLSSVSWMVLHI
jgi:hypothetical protein